MNFLNSQLYVECQLVTAINAAIFLGETPIDPNSEEYERLVDLALSRHGPAITINKVHQYLRIHRKKTKYSLKNFKNKILKGYPLEVSIEIKNYYHSVSIVDYKKENDKNYFKVMNMYGATDDEGWVTFETFKKYWPEQKFLRTSFYFDLAILRKYDILLNEIKNLTNKNPKKWIKRKRKIFHGDSCEEFCFSQKNGIKMAIELIRKSYGKPRKN